MIPSAATAHASEARYVVWTPGAPRWPFPEAQPAPCRSGGHRTLHELAAAIAATGRRVEMRGEVDLAEIELIAEAAGAKPDLPEQPRKPESGDVVLMPEGVGPLPFAQITLSRARRILLLLAPPGLMGWPFVDGWSLEPPTKIDVESVARPEHFRAMSALGFELWAASPVLHERIQAAGVDGSFIGTGRPVPFPEPLPKRYDVVTIGNNRWAELAREAASTLGPGVSHREIPAGTNEEMLRAFGEARIVLHPLRIEGNSRIGREARAMGAVPVVLDSNPFNVGLDEAGGAVAVSSLEEMAGAAMALLRNPERLEQLRQRGMASARSQVDWARYVSRVDEVLSRTPGEVPGRAAMGVFGDALSEREEAVQEEVRTLQAQIETLRRAYQALEADRDAVAAHRDAMAATHAWRLAARYWRVRAGLRRGLGRAERRA